MRWSRKNWLSAGAVVAVVIAAVGYWAVNYATRPRLSFYGVVVDEEGAGVGGAQVTLHTAQAAKDALGYKIAKGSEVYRKLVTDASGRFELEGTDGNCLSVLEIKRPGYAWVHEVFRDPLKRVPSDNRSYLYDSQGECYLPDQSRPAIFPLFRLGSQVIGKPSRGGADRYPDGHVQVNEPTEALVPSAGGNAPRDNEECEARLLELLTKRGYK